MFRKTFASSLIGSPTLTSKATPAHEKAAEARDVERRIIRALTTLPLSTAVTRHLLIDPSHCDVVREGPCPEYRWRIRLSQRKGRRVEALSAVGGPGFKIEFNSVAEWGLRSYHHY